MPQADVAGVYEALVSDPAAELRFKLTPGTILFMDNWRVLHGCQSYTESRQMVGCYMPRDN